MGDYTSVREALAGGADPAGLCATCPWDRNCVNPPAMTSEQVDARISAAIKADQRHAGEARQAGRSPGTPVSTLVTLMAVGSRDITGMLCPVFATRLRSPDGRAISDQVKAIMQAFGSLKAARR